MASSDPAPFDPVPPPAMDPAEDKRRVRLAYDRGRHDEKRRHRGVGPFAVIVGVLAIFGVGMLALAIDQGSFAAGGRLLDDQIAQVQGAAGGAVSNTKAAVGGAVSSAGQSVQHAGATIAGAPSQNSKS
jgi:hypothetical protein